MNDSLGTTLTTFKKLHLLEIDGCGAETLSGATLPTIMHLALNQGRVEGVRALLRCCPNVTHLRLWLYMSKELEFCTIFTEMSDKWTNLLLLT